MNKRKRHVADVALMLFVEKGIQQTSIQDIIDRANISKGTFYNYFTSKNDCIAEILEGLRYDASQLRMQSQVGKNEKDQQVLTEQIYSIIQLNEERNLHALFDAILSSNEKDLKKLVLQHRIFELEWLAIRFKAVFGEEISEHAFECAILFHGMLQHIMFTIRITNAPFSLHRIVEVLLEYIGLIIPHMIQHNTSLIDQSTFHLMRMNIDRKPLEINELLEMAKHLKATGNFTMEQEDLYEAIIFELKQERIRKSVLQSLLNPFLVTFNGTSIKGQTQTFINAVWFYLKLK
ncbi:MULTISPECIES: TetR/AcrR family transcriptional regulator [Psychrobacillus]|jgi:AcrR family transcriptional regulator|uniref:TetR/AcrR family transcriptional regulator n=1 Tax=Psychrobacillus faecigallinarum TaxID=2762235 RepID=A0ABR8RE16_9BACI|nr:MULTISPECIES: TetR/AcrR family transcriptional regulator [Psychrobacillus]MBD7946023.1 TetR/AcrR family transcriptional regulator [Psychrobacillus faecigallinarum]QEY22026.1 TetR/AcrR family transcriptional regulator [Psychrobacillus sp. AK 1817]QGM28900.1 TetR family transcriptional regulator [Bacillus sp. N3536]